MVKTDMQIACDLAVVGSAFGGSLLALIARRLGLTVALIERDRHPRFAIGESSTPLANLLLEELATRYGLPRLLPLCKWGPWQRAYPGIGCGLKRGFSFYHHRRGEAWAPTPARHNELLVAASPNDEIADTQWSRGGGPGRGRRLPRRNQPWLGGISRRRRRVGRYPAGQGGADQRAVRR
jgi:FADH2 O2-dependent halogenase